jgi:hypothetical protein
VIYCCEHVNVSVADNLIHVKASVTIAQTEHPDATNTNTCTNINAVRNT